MKRLLAGAVLAIACASSQGQMPAAPDSRNAQAKALAERLGRELSAEGLETVLATRNPDLWTAYQQGFVAGAVARSPGHMKMLPMPPDVEAVFVRRYRDAAAAARLRALLQNGWIHYQTRELFDLMFAQWRSGANDDPIAPYAVLATDVEGIEAVLTAWLAAADPPPRDARQEIARFLGQRKYAPAVPELAKLQAIDKDLASPATYALLAIATPEAIEALLAHMAAIRDRGSGGPPPELKRIADRLAALPASIPVPYARLRAALPEGTRDYAIEWLKSRKDRDALPDVLALLAGDQAGHGLQALAETDSPEVWKQARAEVERLKSEGRMADERYRYASRFLDGKLADPQKHYTERRVVLREREFSSKKDALGRAGPSYRLRDSDPERHVSELRARLEALEALAAEYSDLPSAVGARGNLATGYLELGHRARFQLKRPRDALELYGAAERHGGLLGTFAAADTLQFDLRDRQRALEAYRKLPARGAVPFPANLMFADPLGDWGRRWVAAQERYLERGSTFSGSIEAGDVSIVSTLVLSGAGAGDLFAVAHLTGAGPDEALRVLNALPASGVVLMHTARLVPLLRDERAILAYLDRHDPAGFATACYFATIELLEQSAKADARPFVMPGFEAGNPAPLLAAKAQFVRQRRIDLGATIALSRSRAERPNR